jgi:ubiquinone/menaquinone biosynthesis C-methylase UbiE
MKEKVQAYWNARPCNIRHSPKPVGTKEYFEEVRNRKYFVESHIPKFADFPQWSGKKVLEIGCGLGTDTISFAQAGASVTAVDFSEASLSIARQRAEVYGLKTINFIQADAEELSKYVPVQPYDLIYSFGVLHHTPNPERAFQEITKYMSSKTVFKFMVYHRASWKVFWIWMKYGWKFLWDVDKLIAQYSEAQIGSPVTYAYTRNSMREFLRPYGYEITEMFVDHIFPFSIPAYKEYHYRKVWYFRWMPPWMFRALEKRFGWHLCVTAKI